MIDWPAVLQWLGGAAFLGLIGVGLRAVFNERGTVMASLLDDVKSLRADALADDAKFTSQNALVERITASLQECRDGRAELARDLKEHKRKISELEARIKKLLNREVPP